MEAEGAGEKEGNKRRTEKDKSERSLHFVVLQLTESLINSTFFSRHLRKGG
jgi:hypothetical protein